MADLTPSGSDYGRFPQEELRSSGQPGGIMMEVHHVEFDDATSSTIALQKTAKVIYVGFSFEEASTGDAFSTGGPYWTVSGTTLTITFAASPGSGTIKCAVMILGYEK